MAENRIEELRRRIQKDPASIAFAQLAEEHRRAGQFEDAVRVCQAGLVQHPAYLSARITLGRALLEMGRYDDAAIEFEYVLKAAPDNLSATRELADIEQRRRGSGQVMPAVPLEPTQNQLPTTNYQPPTTNHEPFDPVIAELEAWLAVLSDERDTRVTRI